MSDQQKNATENKQEASSSQETTTNTGSTPAAPSTDPLPMLIEKVRVRIPPDLKNDVIELEFGPDGVLQPKVSKK